MDVRETLVRGAGVPGHIGLLGVIGPAAGEDCDDHEENGTESAHLLILLFVIVDACFAVNSGVGARTSSAARRASRLA
ncbi:hypothetical protein LRS13_15920 [Svornostia abyssi]|uniref:Uncharacterized protein n=1 Tax=Svornostia abyssi TaxID=2898438 RepID=A0ABY5PC90_9ACTN|nr:hypothetical protein LRS13_15920 [Parviterribacteraceae bacterium J379]